MQKVSTDVTILSSCLEVIKNVNKRRTDELIHAVCTENHPDSAPVIGAVYEV